MLLVHFQIILIIAGNQNICMTYYVYGNRIIQYTIPVHINGLTNNETINSFKITLRTNELDLENQSIFLKKYHTDCMSYALIGWLVLVSYRYYKNS